LGSFSGTYHFNSKPISASRWYCFAKLRLSDENWTFLPFLQCTSIEHGSAPNVGQAQFDAYYGIQLKGSHNINYWDFYYPYLVNGAFILVAGQNSFFTNGPVNPLGIYQINNESVEQYATGNNYPNGHTTFTGLELSGVLDRLFINFSVAVNNFDIRMRIPETFVFNENLVSSNNTTGNRSATKDGGAYYFDLKPNNGQSAWTAYDIIEYIFIHFLNTEENAVNWELDGDGMDVLRNIYIKLDITGKSVFQIFDEIINKNYGLGFSISFNTTTNSPIIWVFSKFPPGVFGASSRGVYRTISLENRNVIQNSLSFDQGAIYDSIEVIGGPVYTTGTFSFYNNNLEEGWLIEDEEEYVTLDGVYPEVTLDEMNEEREKEKYKDVYNKFRIKREWNGVVGSVTLPGDSSGTTTQPYPFGYNYFPSVDPGSGFIDYTYYVAPYLWGKGFEQALPFVDQDNKNIPPIVGIAANKADIDNLSRSELKYFSIENLGNIELPSGSFSIEETEPSFSTDIVPNYTLGKNRIVVNEDTTGATWAGDGSTQINMTLMDGDLIKLRYDNIFITATINTGNKLNLIRNATTNYETKRIKTIDLGDSFNIHLIAPQTIEQIVPNPTVDNYFDLQFSQDPYIYKNDMDKLRDIMFLALNTYSIPRAVCSFTVADPLYGFSVGDYIIADVSKVGVTFINQNITSIRRTLTDSGIQTEVTTSHDELSFESIFANMLDFKYNNRKDYAKGGDGIRKIIKPKKGGDPQKSILVVDDFPAIPTTRTKYIYLKNSGVNDINEQVWEGIPGNTRWYPTAKHTDLEGLPFEINGE